MSRICLALLLTLLLVLPLLGSESALDLYRLGVGAFNDGFYDLARRNFKRLVEVYPENDLADSAQHHVGLSFYLQKNYTAAIFEFQIFQQVFRHSGLRYSSDFYLASSDLGRGNYSASLEGFKRLTQGETSDPLLPSAWLGLGEAAYRLKSYQEAIRALEHFLKTWPSHPELLEARFLLGLAYFRQEDYRAASEVFARELPPSRRAVGLYWLGESRYWLGELRDSKTNFETLIEDWPGSEFIPEARYRIATLWVKLGDQARARAEFRQFVVDWPRHDLTPEALFQLAWLAQEADEFQLALDYYERIVRLFPEARSLGADATYNAALINSRLGNQERALDLFTAIDGLKASREQKLLALKSAGDLALSLGEFERAERAYREVIAGSPEASEEAWYWLGRSLLGARKPQEARETFLSLSENFPNSARIPEVRFLAAEALLKLDRAQEARDEFSQLARDYPQSPFAPTALEGLAWTHYQLGEHEAAVESYGDLITRYPQAPEVEIALYRRGVILFNLKRNPEALASFDEQIKRFPSGSWTSEAIFQTAWIHYKLGSFLFAEAQFSKYQSTYPEGERLSDAWFWRGMSLYRQKKFGAASEVFARLASEFAKDPLAGRALIQAASAAQAIRERELARQYLEIVIKDEGYREVHAEALFELTKIWLAEDQPNHARVFANRLSEEYSDTSWAREAVFRLGEYYFSEGLYESARDSFNQLATRWPEAEQSGSGLYWIGWSYQREGRTAMAAGSFRAYLERYPEHEHGPDARFRLAGLYNELGRTTESLRMYMEVIEGSPGTALAEEAAYQQALVFLATKEEEKAAQNFRVLSVNARSSQIKSRSLRQLGSLRIKRFNEFQTGTELLRQAIEADQGEAGAEARLELARVYRARGEEDRASYALAYDELVKVLYLHLEQRNLLAEALWLAADTQYRLGNRATALKHLENLFRDFSEGEWVIKGRALKEIL